jgi:APA family basic amino acid/polyamine antiporter
MIMGNSSVFIMAGLIMVSTLDVIVAWSYLVGDYFMRWLKTAFSLNKLPFWIKVPAKALWVQCAWACVAVFLVSLETC